MADATTTYDVITRYLVQDGQQNASIKVMHQHVTALDKSIESTKSNFGLLGRIGGMVAGYLGFQQANTHLIKFNSSMEQAKITMAGMMAQAGRGNYTENLEQASTLVKQMQLDARASVGTTQDFVQMAQMLVQPLFMAGGSMENLRDLTRQTVVASRAMGIEAGVAARDIDQAIRGVYRSVDPFSGKVLTPMGYGGEEGRRKFNALSMPQRLAEIQKGLGSQAIRDMAKAQETSYEGAISTFVDNLQMTLGKVGMPLFKGLTAELNQWNIWLDKNQNKIQEFARTLGGDILSAATKFKDVMAFLAEHWKQVLGAAVAIKATGVLTSVASAGKAGATGAAGAAAGSAGMPFFAGKLAAVTLVASAVYMTGTAIADWIDKKQSERFEAAGRFDQSTLSLFDKAKNGVGKGDARAFAAMAKMQGLADDSGNVNQPRVLAGIQALSDEQRLQLARSMGSPTDKPWMLHSEVLAQEAAKQFAIYLREAMATRPEQLMSMETSQAAALAKVEKPKINVTINRIEVATDDPDRFVMRMVGAFRDAAKNPSGVGAALHTLREG